MEGLTEDQLKTINSEIDRRVTEAVQTNAAKVTEQVTKNLTESLRQQYENDFNTKLENEKQQLAMSNEEKTQNLLKQLNEQQKTLNEDRMRYNAERKLRESGLNDETIDSLIGLFVPNSEVNAETVNSNIDAFVTARNSAIENALQKQREELALSGGAPKTNGGNTPTMTAEQKSEAILNSNDIDPMLKQAMAVGYLFESQS